MSNLSRNIDQMMNTMMEERPIHFVMLCAVMGYIGGRLLESVIWS